MSTTKTSIFGLAEIAGHEGIVPYPYRDSAGVWTFGIGHTSAAGAPDPSALPRGEARPLSTVFELFAEDIRRYEHRVRRAVKVPITQTQFDALVSFDFNTGGIHRAKLTKKLNEGDLSGAAAAFDGWKHPPEIVPRRTAEKVLFRDGTYSHNGMATAHPADREGRVQWAKGERINVLAVIRDRLAAQPDDPGPIDTDRLHPAERRGEDSTPQENDVAQEERVPKFVWLGAGGAVLFLMGRFWGATKWVASKLWVGLKAIGRAVGTLLGRGR